MDIRNILYLNALRYTQAVERFSRGDAQFFVHHGGARGFLIAIFPPL